MGATPIRNLVLDALKQTPWEPVTGHELTDRVNELANGAGPFESTQVLNSAGQAVRTTPELGIVRVGRGAYSYHPRPKAAAAAEDDSRVFGVLRSYDDGRLLLEASDGGLYAAKPIEDLWA